MQILPQDTRGETFANAFVESLSSIAEKLEQHKENNALKALQDKHKNSKDPFGFINEASTDPNISQQTRQLYQQYGMQLMTQQMQFQHQQEMEKQKSEYAEQLAVAKAAAKAQENAMTPRDLELYQKLIAGEDISPEDIAGMPTTKFGSLASAAGKSPTVQASKVEEEATIRGEVKAAQKYYDSVLADEKHAKEGRPLIDAALKSSGKTGLSFRNLAHSYFKQKNSPFADLLISPEMQDIERASKYLLGTNLKQIVSGKQTEKEFFWVAQAILPSILKAKSVNIGMLKDASDLIDTSEKKAEIMRNIVKEKGKVPRNIEALVSDKMNDYLHEKFTSLMEKSDAIIGVTFKDGTKVQMPANEAMKLIKNGDAELMGMPE